MWLWTSTASVEEQGTDSEDRANRICYWAENGYEG